MQVRSSLFSVFCFFCIFLWLFSPPIAECQTAEELIASQHVMIQVRVEPETVFVGQKVEILIDVMTRNWFLEAPRLQAGVEIPDAIVLPPESFGVNFSRRINGETYAGQTRKLSLFPTAPGTYEVPPVEVTLVVAGPDMKPTEPIKLHSPALTFETTLPSAVRGLGLIIATPELTLNHTISQALDDLHVGDSFDRTITMTIRDSVAMLLPAPVFTVPEGIAVYPSRPELSDQRNRGQMSGTRIDTVTYVLEKEGSFEAPEIVIRWWNPGSNELMTEIVPALSLEVKPSSALSDEHLSAPIDEFGDEEIVVEDSGATHRKLAVLFLSALALMILIRAIRHLATLHFRRPPNPEREAWKALRSVCRGDDPAAILPAFYHWFDLIPGGGAPAWRNEFRSAASEILIWLEHLEQAQYGRDTELTKQVMPSALPRWRRKRLNELKGAGKARRQTGLGSLNPS